MTGKRFTTNKYYIYDHFKEDKWLVNEVEAEEIVTVMNNLDTKARERSKALSKLQKENEQLKTQLQNTSDQRDEFHRGARENANRVGKLEKENKQLKQQLKTKCIVNKQYEENQRLIKMLDNVANYMQKQHKDMPIDDFVEWWNGIATKGLDGGDVE